MATPPAVGHNGAMSRQGQLSLRLGALRTAPAGADFADLPAHVGASADSQPGTFFMAAVWTFFCLTGRPA
jgi:hypothetical protein